MKWNVIFLGVGLLALSGCSPDRRIGERESVEAEIAHLRGELARLDELEARELESFRTEQESLSLSIQAMQTERDSLADEIAQMETWLQAPDSLPPKAYRVERVRLRNQTAFEAKVTVIRNGQVTLLRNGNLQTGPLSAIEKIQFRIVSPETLSLPGDPSPPTPPR